MEIKKSYIGITGFTTREQIDAAISYLPPQSDKLLMIGVLVSWKSLRGLPLNSERQKRFPHKSELCNLFQDNPRVLNLVHYNSHEGEEESLVSDMIELHYIMGPNLHGFQINMAWPSLDSLDDYAKVKSANDFKSRIVLQIGEQAIKRVNNNPQELVVKLSDYTGTIDDILFDPSAGTGKPLNPEQARIFLSAIADRGWNIGLGVAGGLGPNSLELVQPLVEEFPGLSIDAEKNVRDHYNELDLEAVRLYLERAA